MSRLLKFRCHISYKIHTYVDAIQESDKDFLRGVTTDLFLYQTAFCFDRHFLRDVLEGSHRRTSELANPDKE